MSAFYKGLGTASSGGGSSFDPSTVSDLDFCIDGSQGEGVGYELTGGDVSTIYDLSTNGDDATQSSASLRPQLSTMNGLTCFAPDGTEYMDLPSGSILANGANKYPLTFFAVVAASAAHGTFETLATIGAGANRLDIMLNSGALRAWDGTGSGNAIPTDGTPTVVAFQLGASGILYATGDLVDAIVSDAHAAIPDNDRKLFAHTSGANPFSGKVGEIRIYRRLLPPSEMDDVLLHLDNKWVP